MTSLCRPTHAQPLALQRSAEDIHHGKTELEALRRIRDEIEKVFIAFAAGYRRALTDSGRV